MTIEEALEDEERAKVEFYMNPQTLVLDVLSDYCMKKGLYFRDTRGTKEDLVGKYDCVIEHTKIDVKAERSRDDTVQLSLGWTNSNGYRDIPGYFKKTDVHVWIFDLNEGLDHFYSLKPLELRRIQENPEDWGTIYIKPPHKDLFQRQHTMLVIPKINLRKVDLH